MNSFVRNRYNNYTGVQSFTFLTGMDLRERVIDVVGCESEFDRDKYPTAEVVELFPVPEKGAIRILAE